MSIYQKLPGKGKQVIGRFRYNSQTMIKLWLGFLGQTWHLGMATNYGLPQIQKFFINWLQIEKWDKGSMWVQPFPKDGFAIIFQPHIFFPSAGLNQIVF